MGRRVNLSRKGLTLSEIAEREGVTPVAIRKHLKRRGVTWTALQPARFTITEQGYERWEHKFQGKGQYYFIHRLAAIAWFGLEPVKQNHVHHRNGIPWDNREENLELLSPGAHNKEHDATDNFPDPTIRPRREDGTWAPMH